MRRVIAVGVVCLVIGVAGGARAQETPDDGSPASVEMSLSFSPSFLISLAGAGIGGTTGGLGALGGLGAFFQPQLDVGFALDARTLLVLGLGASYAESAGAPMVSISTPLSVLWYLETPRVGHVMPMLRIGATFSYTRAEAGAQDYESYSIGGLAHGGITWLAARNFAIRAELGARAGASVAGGPTVQGTSGWLGMDALVGLVLRV